MDGHSAALGLVIVIIIVALAFDYVNGFHDAANSIATVVATRVLSPGVAVAWAAFFNFVAFLVFGTAVAKTIGGDMVNIAVIPQGDQLYVLLAGGARRDHLEPHHMVPRAADIKLARACRRIRRLCSCRRTSGTSG